MAENSANLRDQLRTLAVELREMADKIALAAEQFQEEPTDAELLQHYSPAVAASLEATLCRSDMTTKEIMEAAQLKGLRAVLAHFNGGIQ